jgi:hypothetical protein
MSKDKPNKTASIKKSFAEAQRAFIRLEELIVTMSLFVLVYTGFWVAFEVGLSADYLRYILMFASFMVALLALGLFVKHLRNEK